jgi:hypothetical protein
MIRRALSWWPLLVMAAIVGLIVLSVEAPTSADD